MSVEGLAVNTRGVHDVHKSDPKSSLLDKSSTQDMFGIRTGVEGQSDIWPLLNAETCQWLEAALKDLSRRNAEVRSHLLKLIDWIKVTRPELITNLMITFTCPRLRFSLESIKAELSAVKCRCDLTETEMDIQEVRVVSENFVDLQIAPSDPRRPAVQGRFEHSDLIQLELSNGLLVSIKAGPSGRIQLRVSNIIARMWLSDLRASIEVTRCKLDFDSNLSLSVVIASMSATSSFRPQQHPLVQTCLVSGKELVCVLALADTFLTVTVSPIVGPSFCLVMMNGLVEKRYGELSLHSRVDTSMYCFDAISHGWESCWRGVVIESSFRYIGGPIRKVQVDICFAEEKDVWTTITLTNRMLCNVIVTSSQGSQLVTKASEIGRGLKCLWIENCTLLQMDYQCAELGWHQLNPNETKQLDYDYSHVAELVGHLGTESDQKPFLSVQLKLAGETLGVVCPRNGFRSFLAQITVGVYVVDFIRYADGKGLLIRVRTAVHVLNACSAKLHLGLISNHLMLWRTVLETNHSSYIPESKDGLCVNGMPLKMLSKASDRNDMCEIIKTGSRSILVQMQCKQYPLNVELIMSDPINIANELPIPISYILSSSTSQLEGRVAINSVEPLSSHSGILQSVTFYYTANGSSRLSDCRLNLAGCSKSCERALVIATKSSYIPAKVVIKNDSGLTISLYPEAVIRCRCKASIQFKFVTDFVERSEAEAKNLPEVWYADYKANKGADIVFPNNASVHARLFGSISAFSLVDLSARYLELHANGGKRAVYFALCPSTMSSNFKVWCVRELYCLINKTHLAFNVCLANQWESIPANSTSHPQWPYAFKSNSGTLKMRTDSQASPIMEVPINPKTIHVTYMESRMLKWKHFIRVQTRVLVTNQIEVLIEDCDAPYRFINHTKTVLKLRQNATHPWTLLNANISLPFSFTYSETDTSPIVQLALATHSPADVVAVDLDNFSSQVAIKTHPHVFSISADDQVLTVDLPPDPNSAPRVVLRNRDACTRQCHCWYVEDNRLFNTGLSILGHKHVLDIDAGLFDVLDPSKQYDLCVSKPDESRSKFQKWIPLDRQNAEQKWHSGLTKIRIVNHSNKNVGIRLQTGANTPCLCTITSVVNLDWNMDSYGDLLLSKRVKNGIQLFDINEYNVVGESSTLVGTITLSIKRCIASLVHRSDNRVTSELCCVTMEDVNIRSNIVCDVHNREFIRQSSTASIKSLNIIDLSANANSVIPVISFDKHGDGRAFKRSIFCSVRSTGFMDYIDRYHLGIAPAIVCLDEGFVLGLVQFAIDSIPNVVKSPANKEQVALSLGSRRIRNILIDPISASVTFKGRTNAQLSDSLVGLKSRLGIPSISNMVNISDACVRLGTFQLVALTGSQQILDNVLQKSTEYYYSALKAQLMYLVGSIDFLGNPARLLRSIASGLTSSLISWDSGALVGGISHGLADATSKIASCLSDSFEQFEKGSCRPAQEKVLDTTSNQMSGTGTTQGVLSGVVRTAISTVSVPIAGVLNVVQDIAQVVKNETEYGVKSDQNKASQPMLPHVPAKRYLFVEDETPFCFDTTPSFPIDVALNETVINVFSRNNCFHLSELKEVVVTNKRIMLTGQGKSSSRVTKSIDFEMVKSVTWTDDSILSLTVTQPQGAVCSFKCLNNKECLRAHNCILHLLGYLQGHVRYLDVPY